MDGISIFEYAYNQTGGPPMSLDAQLRRRLKLRDLDTLMVVARSRSMAKAAAQLSMSQPAVSKAIAEIEHTLGVRLLDRTSHGVEPTRYGQVLVKWGIAIFDDIAQSVKEIEFVADPTVGELSIGVIESLVVGLLPAIIERVQRKYPRISFRITQAPTPQPVLRERTVDVLLTRIEPSMEEPDLVTEVLFNDPVFVVASRKSRWGARRGPISLAELAEETWIFASQNLAWTLGAEIFHAAGLQLPRASILGNSIQMKMALLATGRYLTVLPRSALHFHAARYDVKTLPVKLPNTRHPVGVVMLRSRAANPVTQNFVECAREVAKQFRN